MKLSNEKMKTGQIEIDKQDSSAASFTSLDLVK